MHYKFLYKRQKSRILYKKPLTGKENICYNNYVGRPKGRPFYAHLGKYSKRFSSFP